MIANIIIFLKGKVSKVFVTIQNPYEKPFIKKNKRLNRIKQYMIIVKWRCLNENY